MPIGITLQKVHHISRTTLSIDDEVFDLARRYARGRAIGLGQAVSDLVRKGLQKELGTRTVNGLAVFDLPADSPAVTPKDVEHADEEV